MKKVIISFVFVIFVSAFVGLLVYGSPRNFLSYLQSTIVQMMPVDKSMDILSENASHNLIKSTHEYLDNTAADLGVYSVGTYTSNSSPQTPVPLSKLSVIFTNEPQDWGLIVNLNGEVSNFSFSIDEFNRGTMRIWVNPAELENKSENAVSLIINRSLFIALYTVSRWNTVDYHGSEYMNYLLRIDNELTHISISERPIVVESELD